MELAADLQLEAEEVSNRIKGLHSPCKDEIELYDALIPYVDR